MVLEGKTTSRRLAPGHQVELVDDRRGDVTGTWVVLEVVHDVVAAAGLVSESDGVEPYRYVVVRLA